MIKVLRSARETKLFAARLARKIGSAKTGKHAFVVGLAGELGAGKTTFVQGFAKTFAVKHRIASPTFLIFRAYDLGARSGKFSRLYHLDLYRVRKFDELEILGFKKILDSPENIVLIEWADKIKSRLPADCFWLTFKHGAGENDRTLEIKGKIIR